MHTRKLLVVVIREKNVMFPCKEYMFVVGMTVQVVDY
jgi:hypothetical protein